MARVLLASAALLGLMTGCSLTGRTGRGSEHPSVVATRSPVPLQATQAWVRAACGGFPDLRHLCPFAAPAARGTGVTLSMALGTARYPLNLLQVESGGEYFGNQRRNRPPRFVGWFLMSGHLKRVLPAIYPRLTGPGTRPRNGQAETPRRRALSLGRMRWGGRTGQLVLAPSDGPEALVYFHYLVFRWRQAGREVAIGLHAWEPFRETVQTLHAMVDRLRSVASTPIAQMPVPHSHPVPLTTPPEWFTLACRSLRTRVICPTQIPAGPTNYISLLYEPRWRSSHTRSDDLLSVEWGAPRSDAARNRPPAFVHLELAAGGISLAGHIDAGPVAPRNGMMAGRESEAAAPTIKLISRGWPGRGSLVLGDCFGNHLCYRWRQGGEQLQLDLHGWEPFTQTVATLRKIVRSIPAA
jgi:hypothetical protein